MSLFRHNQSSRLSVYFRDDIHDALIAIDSANLGLVDEIAIWSKEAQAFQRGYQSALRSLGQVFGIDYQPLNRMPARQSCDQSTQMTVEKIIP
jgi:hypothetical protein